MLNNSLAACLEHNLDDGHGRSRRRHHCLDRIARIRPFDHLDPILLCPLLGIHRGHHLHRLGGREALYPHGPRACLGHDEVGDEDPRAVLQGRHQILEDNHGIFVRPVV